MLHHYVKVSDNIKKFAADASGATAIEYGLIAALIAVAIIGTVVLLGDEVVAMFQNVADEVAAAS